MRLNNEIIFTFIKYDNSRVRIANSDIGNLESFEITYEVALLDSSPLVSSSTLYFQEDAMEVVLDYFNKHRPLLHLEIDHPDIGIVKYLVDKSSIKLKEDYVEANLILANLYNMLADKKDVKYDVDLNAIPKHKIELPEVQGINRMLFYGANEVINSDIKISLVSVSLVVPQIPWVGSKSITLNTGWLPIPMTIYKSDIVNKNSLEYDTLIDQITVPASNPSNLAAQYSMGPLDTTFSMHDIYNNPFSIPIEKFNNALYLLKGFSERSKASMKINCLAPYSLKMKVVLSYNTNLPDIDWDVLAAKHKFNIIITVETRLSTYTVNLLPKVQATLNTGFNMGSTATYRSIDTISRFYLLEVPVTINFSEFQISREFTETTAESYRALRPEFRISAQHSFTNTYGTSIIGVGFKDLELVKSAPFTLGISYEAPFRTKEAFVYKPVDLITAGLMQMASTEQFNINSINVEMDNIDSNYPDNTLVSDEDLPYYNYDLTFLPVESFKNKNKKMYYFKLSDVIKVLYGLGYQLFSDSTSLYFRKRTTSERLDLIVSESSEVEMSFSKLLLSSVEVGYNLDEASTSTIDPHRRVTYKSLIQHKAETLSMLLPYRGDAVGLMKTLDDEVSKVDDTDYWWDFFKGEDTIKIDSVDVADTSIFMVVVKNREGDIPIATTDGIDPSIARLNIFNWQLSTAALMYYLADYLKYSGNFFELTSSYGIRDFSVQMFPYSGLTKETPSAFFQVMAGPVLNLEELTHRVEDSTESYGALELSTSIILPPEQILDIIESNAAQQKVYINLPNLGVSGLLLSAKISIVFDRAVDIVMLIEQDYKGYETPKMLLESVIPTSKSLVLPKAIYPNTALDYYLFYNSEDVGIELIYGVTQISGPAGYDISSHIVLTTPTHSTVPVNSSSLFNRTVLITISDLSSLIAGTYVMKIQVQKLSDLEEFTHTIILTD